MRQYERAAAEAGARGDTGRRTGARAPRTWEGNVRELRNVIERACILADGEFITERRAGGQHAGDAAAAVPPRDATPGRCRRRPRRDKELLVTVERDHIQRALVRAGGNKKAAAQNARPQPPCALPPARTARPVEHHHAPP